MRQILGFACVARALLLVGGVLFCLGAASAAYGQQWVGHGPGGGAVEAVAIDPKTPTTVYAGTSAGVFKSTDGGESWTATRLVFGAVTSLAIDPETPSTI